LRPRYAPPTRRYSLDEINQGYQDLDDGKNIRGVILHGR
jgi:S-(hydroxymethyl)glutathione dehydrogenase/alcohol dehydrogenase